MIKLNAKLAAIGTSVVAIGAATVLATGAPAQQPAPQATPFTNLCTAEAMQALAPAGVTVKAIKNGTFAGATRLVAARGMTPAYCQVVGSFVTNPATGKTANFQATFPAKWNGKYMQLGCSGHCGQFYVSNPALPTITVTAQGYGSEILDKGYATFATDEGHEGLEPAAWAVRQDGSVDQDFVDDLFYRADKVLIGIGKQFTAAVYASANGAPQTIAKSYFNGCSGGGRDAMVAASYFPDEFDGIIAGSPYDAMGMGLQASAIGAASARPGGLITPELLALFDKTVKTKCDAGDGLSDGIIQNPLACDFNPERDLPRCSAGQSGNQCFTQAQAETASVIVSGMTDERGRLIQPGYSVSELAVEPAAMAELTDNSLKVFVHRNDPAFKPASLFSFRRGGPGPVSAFHAVVPAAEVARVRAAWRLGAGHLPENIATFAKSKTKLLIWHNFSDEKLTPLSSIRWYQRLAAGHGGYAKVQQKARLFMLPGTGHCSITGVAPNSFDAVGALENWVEKGEAPSSLTASVAFRQYSPGAAKPRYMTSPNATMPLCAYPAMAKYSGQGDPTDGRNWSCPAGDKSLLTIGEAGRQAGASR